MTVIMLSSIAFTCINTPVSAFYIDQDDTLFSPFGSPELYKRCFPITLDNIGSFCSAQV